MDLRVNCIPSPVFWSALQNAPVGQESFATQFLSFENNVMFALQPYDILQSWKNDLFYHVPKTPEPISAIAYLITPPAKAGVRRVFVALNYGARADKGILVEVTPLQMQIRVKGFHTPDGGTFALHPSYVDNTVLKGDSAPIHIQLQDPSKGIGITVIEEPDPSNPEAPARLLFDITNDGMASGYINRNANVLNDLMGGINQ